ncbi:flagellar basal-body MS-ring/collar protein FliF [Sphingomonas oligophenolica]|uniref:Flagellar basal-body MS-ring/collar protein FliF n=2 Tax=Sphingomonas oligophenolica TaxID=301154 RepID=A0ABU9Y401_9SPHN
MFTRQRQLFLGIFAVVCLILAAGYYLFLRADYAVLYTDLKPADASAIVAQLDAKGVSHRLRDNGTTILVPTDQADTVRLAVAGSDIPMKGAVGFELFNKSDMGLTDFAQKINYQRALQGELARTIMMMDGIESARIHLALPERSLFRGNRAVPKAAVEVIAKPGRSLTPDRVAGIQQLVASAVPDLALGDVAILDGDGRIVSQAPPSEALQTPEIDEQTAARNYYSARAKAAIATLMPGVQIGVQTLIMSGSGARPDEPASSGGTTIARAVGAPAGGGRDFQLRMTILTETPLNAEDQGVARNAVAAAVGLDEQHGDSLSFEVGPTTTPSPAPPLAAKPVAGAVEPAAAPVPVAFETGLGWWIWALAGIVAVLAIIVLLRRRPGDLTPLDRDAFVARLRQQIQAEGNGDVRV